MASGENPDTFHVRHEWDRELEYRLIKELRAFPDNRISVRFAYEWHDDTGQWFRTFGNAYGQFDESGLMAIRHACLNDMPIRESDRKFFLPLAPRPDDHPGLGSVEF